MTKTIVLKALCVGRTTALALGLAVMLALILGTATKVFGATGDPFKVGKTNVASAVSTLVKRGAGPALSLQVGSGPPLRVNSDTRVANLNADQVDNLSTSQLVKTSETLWAVVDGQGSLARGEGVAAATKDGVGAYLVTFDRNVESCAWVATLIDGPGEIGVGRLGPNQALLEVTTHDSAGTFRDAPFSVVVHC